MSKASTPPNEGGEIGLDRDVFLRRLLHELAGTLQNVVGLDEASGYISVVGAAMGEHIEGEYRRALAVDRLSREQVATVLVDLQRRIQGDFFVIEETEDRIVLGNRACPFGEFVLGRPSLCMMTSNVFGSIAARLPGQGRQGPERTIRTRCHGRWADLHGSDLGELRRRGRRQAGLDCQRA